MLKLSEKDTVLEMNKLGQLKCPFLFIIGFDKTENIVVPLDEISPEEIKYAFNDEFSIYQNFFNEEFKSELEISSELISFDSYKRAFGFVKNNLELGNSFLTNLTVSNRIKVNIAFETIIDFTKAIELSKNTPDQVHYFNRAGAKYELEDYIGCIEDCSIAIEIDPKFIGSYVERGRAKLMLGQNEGACADFNKAVSLGFIDTIGIIQNNCK